MPNVIFVWLLSFIYSFWHSPDLQIVDMVHSTNTDKLKDYKLILSISVSGLQYRGGSFSWILINIIGYLTTDYCVLEECPCYC